MAAASSVTLAGNADAAGAKKRARPASFRPSEKKAGPFAWCAPEVEALSEDVCHIGSAKDAEAKGRRTLVIFLHGAIARDTDWSWTQERALTRQAKQSGFEAIFPRSPLAKSGYVWPGSVEAVSDGEGAIIDGWMAAKKKLEARNGRPFDDVFVMGFSSGAYFVSSLALRGRLDVDGYAVFAGGSGLAGPKVDASRRVPVFVGVCAQDTQTRAHSRAFAGAVASLGFPHRSDEQPIGHMFGDAHVAHAVSWLRANSKRAPHADTAP